MIDDTARRHSGRAKKAVQSMNHTDLINLMKAWEKFDRGDAISDDELWMLIDSAESGVKYLTVRRERFVAHKTRLDLEVLKGYAKERGKKP